MRYEWTEHLSPSLPDVVWTVDSEAGLLADGRRESFSECDCWPAQILRLAARVRELESERDRAWDRVIRERDGKRAKIAALEEENFALKGRVTEAEETAESDRRTSAQAFEQVERLGKENERLRELRNDHP